jgi:GNAT superfamily N-acetyltransferase
VSAVADIEDALVAHWSHFGRWPRGELHADERQAWFATPIKELPYNGVLRTRLGEGSAARATIGELVERFRSRDVQFFWLVHPSATPSDLAAQLAGHGLRQVERMFCMSLELASWRHPVMAAGVVVEEVLDDAGLDAYTGLTMKYWELSGDSRELVAEVHRYWGPGRAPGHRYLARIDGEPVGKAYVSLAGPPSVASIYGMSVVPEARGRGVARALTAALLARARDAGCNRAVLHSTEMAIGVYRRAGFVDRCTIDVFATAALWSDQH